jgi:hypothetical protein
MPKFGVLHAFTGGKEHEKKNVKNDVGGRADRDCNAGRPACRCPGGSDLAVQVRASGSVSDVIGKLKSMVHKNGMMVMGDCIRAR